MPVFIESILWGLRPELVKLTTHRDSYGRVQVAVDVGHQSATKFFQRHSRVVECHLKDLMFRFSSYLWELQYAGQS